MIMLQLTSQEDPGRQGSSGQYVPVQGGSPCATTGMRCRRERGGWPAGLGLRVDGLVRWKDSTFDTNVEILKICLK